MIHSETLSDLSRGVQAQVPRRGGRVRRFSEEVLRQVEDHVGKGEEAILSGERDIFQISTSRSLMQ